MSNEYNVMLLSVLMIISTIGCKQRIATSDLTIESTKDLISLYRDTIVGKFNGIDIDTLICEPVGKFIKDDLFGEFYTEWRVYIPLKRL